MEGSYLMPRSMCSVSPKPKFPMLLKQDLGNSYSFTLRPFSRISDGITDKLQKLPSAFGPRTVQWTAIFSLRRIANVRIVNLALLNTGCWPVNCSSTFAARVSLSPLSPTQIFKHNFWIRISRMGFADFSFFSFILTTILPGTATSTCTRSEAPKAQWCVRTRIGHFQFRSLYSA